MHVPVVAAVIRVEAITAQRHADAAAVVTLQLLLVVGHAVQRTAACNTARETGKQDVLKGLFGTRKGF